MDLKSTILLMHELIFLAVRKPKRQREIIPCNYIMFHASTFVFQEFTVVVQREGEPWPVERYNHAACCIGYTGDHVHLLVCCGLGRDGNILEDMWLFNVSSKRWKEVRLIIASCHDKAIHLCIMDHTV